MSITVASFNVAGIRDPPKRKSIFKYIRDKKYHISLIQETHCSHKHEKLWQMEWGGEIVWAHGTNRSKGVAILFSKNLTYSVIEQAADPNGRFLITSVKIGNRNLTIANIYGPNNDNPDFFNIFFTRLISAADGDMIVGGDFNVILNSTLDKNRGPPHANKNSRVTVQAYMSTLELYDVFRHRQGDARKYSRIQTNPMVATRIDFFLTSKSLLTKVTSANIVTGIMSDHKIVTMTLNVAPNVHGKGYWKLNTRLLDNKQYIELMRKTIKDYIITNPANHVNPHVRWDALKAVLRGVSIEFSARLKKENSARQNELERNIEALEEKISRTNGSPLDPNAPVKLTQLKSSLDVLVENKTKGAIIRSRTLWAEKGEKNTKYFLNLEKRHVVKKSINRLKNGDQVYTDQKSILTELSRFYEDLYKRRDPKCPQSQIDSYLANLNLPKLNAYETETSEDPISKDEIKFAINTMPKNKSPGLDGLPAEFYQCFWPDITSIFCEAWDYTEETGHFSQSQAQGVLTLIPKPHKDPLLTTNYRPISLLNTDYKIMSKVINNRIRKHIKHLIKPDQNGFMKGRYIGDNLRVLFDIIDSCDFYEVPGAVLSLDIYKAFDTISWDYIASALNAFGFGNKLKRWIKCCYSRPTCRITNNNFLSKAFRIERGVRQGDPLSPTLFLICIECLAEALRQDTFQGIKLKNKEFKVSLLADDTLIFLRGDQTDFDRVFRVLDMFGEMSGCKLNMGKSLAFFIGPKRLSEEKPYADKGLAWPNTSFRYLGVEIPIKDRKQLFSLNFGNMISKISAILNIWSSRGLTLLGRICILKSLVLPTLIYKISVLPITLPNIFLRKLKTKLFQFVWGSKWERIKRNTLIANVDNGGANMLDVESYILSLNLKWVLKLLDVEYEAPWKHLEKNALSLMELESWVRGNLPTSSKQCAQIIPLQTVRKIITDIRSITHVVHSPKTHSRALWASKSVRLRSKTFYLKPLINAGILDYSDLLNSEGEYYKYDQLADKYKFTPNNTDFKIFIKMVAALPPEWDHTDDLSKNNLNLIDECLEMFQEYKTPKALYNKIKQYVTVCPEKQQKKWERDLNLTPNTTPWEKLYSKVYHSTFETKLRSFQIKLNLRAIVTNEALHSFGKTDSDQCVFCLKGPETVSHLFYRCEHVKSYWEDVTSWISAKLLFSLRINPVTLVFGTHLDDDLLNCLLLCARFVIYRCKYGGTLPTLCLFISLFKSVKTSEYVSALKNNRLATFKVKWAGL
uniref:Pol-like protein n=1 Tax=Phallusia mammillata TaxID=59560 RepID=A0A6F9DMW6_9ASCI|nr:pol-like protein [Phallusia mammillata]